MNTNTNNSATPTTTRKLYAPPTFAAVLEQLGAEIATNDGERWTLDQETADELENVTRCPYGAAGGFTGFIYYTETWDFFKKNRAAIVQHLGQLADDIGDGCAVELVRGFNCFKRSKPSTDAVGRMLWGPLDNFEDDEYNISNACAWFALEEAANAWEDGETVSDESEEA